ncbi:hypothetical protein Pelo_1354 [Pelomyxa schiedti]|nr:hypothetical protein Pelo_1354 [Pelomyxa schiedti]
MLGCRGKVTKESKYPYQQVGVTLHTWAHGFMLVTTKRAWFQIEGDAFYGSPTGVVAEILNQGSDEDDDDSDTSLIYHSLIPEEYKLAQWDSGPDGYSETVYFLSHDKMLTLLETPAFKNASICDKKPHSEDSEDSESSPDGESEDEESPAKKKPGDPGPGITNTEKEESPQQKSSQKAHHSHDSTTPTTKHKASPQPSSSSTSTTSSSSSTTVPSKPNTVPTKHKKKKRVYFKTDTTGNKHPPAPDDDYPNKTAVSLPSKRPRNKDAGADTTSPTTERPSPPATKHSHCSNKH